MTNNFSFSPQQDIAQARRSFMWVFTLSLLVKLWLAAYFPFTGDEAFFYQWGIYPDWGYYDHPPMVGWLLYALNSFSSHPLILRIVTVLLWSGIALGMLDLMRRIDPAEEEKSWRLATVFLLLPFTWGLNVVTTDTPLILFMFVSGYCYLRGDLSGRLGWYVATGIFLGLALLSKYFAGLLAIAYFVHFLFTARTGKGLARLLTIAVCALPFAAINVGYNATHCWSNVMFNLLNRNEDAQWSFETIAIYLVMMLYLLTPWTLLAILRAPMQRREQTALITLFVMPFALFLLLSAKKNIGLHWVLGFMPFLFMYAGMVISIPTLRKHVRFNAWLSAPHLLALLALMYLPLSTWQGWRLHSEIVMHKSAPELVAALQKNLPPNGVMMARAYTPASLLSFHAGQYWPVFGVARYHARQDDVIVDFRQYAGKPVRIFDLIEIDPAALRPYFDNVTVGSVEVGGARFWYADGTNFNYAVYKEQVLKTIAERYYRIPSALPVYGCQFLERYEFERAQTTPSKP